MCVYIYIYMVRLPIARKVTSMYKNDKSTLMNVTNAIPKKSVLHVRSKPYKTLQHSATHCNCTSEFFLSRHINEQHMRSKTCPKVHYISEVYHALDPSATLCNTMDHSATLWITLQLHYVCKVHHALDQPATHCNTLQHTATHCNCTTCTK